MDKILFVVILYNQKLSESNVYKSLLSNKEDSFDGIIVFDNSKYNQQKDIDTLKLNIIYIWNKGVNYYLSKNYNTASKYAIENDYNFFLTPSGTKNIIFSKTYEEHLMNKNKYIN